MDMPARLPAATPPSDVTCLAHAARGGDIAALGALYDCFAAMLYATAYRLCGNTEDAQDVVHDCFVGLPEALRHYDERGRLDAWLRRVVVRLVLMRRRGASRRREDAFDDDLQLAGRERTDALAEHRDVQRAVAALPESLRDVFILKQVEGYRHDEIATLLGITEGASRVRLTRAVDALRRALVER